MTLVDQAFKIIQIKQHYKFFFKVFKENSNTQLDDNMLRRLDINLFDGIDLKFTESQTYIILREQPDHILRQIILQLT